MSIEVPVGWEVCPLEEVARIIRGITFPTEVKRHEPQDGHVACLRTANVQSEVEWEDLWYVPREYVKHEDQYVRAGDVLISTANSYELVGKVAQVRNPKIEASLGAFISLLRTEPGVSASYFYYLLSSESVQRAIREKASTTTNLSNVSGAKLKELPLPIAPSAEQRRIVEKLEELLSDLDAGVAELKAAQRKLAQYRQSLLKAAVEGALTADWRATHGKPQESGAELLQRILSERRARWEQKQLAKFAEQGKTPPMGWQVKYPEPGAPDLSDLPALPQGWTWTSLDALLDDVEAGRSFKCEERPPNDGEVGVAKVSAVSWGEYDEEESKTCRDESFVKRDLFIEEGDFLFSRANTIELVGACVIAERVTKRIMLSDKILRLILVESQIAYWLLALLRSPFGRTQIENLSTGNQESMRNIGQGRMRQIVIPLPPMAEISAGSTLLLQGFESAGALEEATKHSVAQLVAQRKNILKSAFAGQLVPQDPSDEPASELLARIRAERASNHGSAPRRRRKTT